MDFVELKPGHDDVINDIVFNHYGRRFASCSSDKRIKVWTLDESKGIWYPEEVSSRAHQDSIWRLSWSHPEFGHLLASCSEDCTVKIWEEQDHCAASAKQTRWVPKATLTDGKRPVNDVKFAHRSLGLRLATASADGCLRIYDARSAFDISSWTLEIEHQVEASAGSAGEAVPVRGRGPLSLCWNDCPFEPSKLAVGTSTRGTIIYSVNENRIVEECVLNDGVGSPINDVAWAPSMGRSYHLIATAAKEPNFKIHQLRRNEEGVLCLDSTQIVSTGKSVVWRVAWNATGTVLVTSAEDGMLGIWRKSIAGEWKHVQSLPSNMENKMSYLYVSA